MGLIRPGMGTMEAFRCRSGVQGVGYTHCDVSLIDCLVAMAWRCGDLYYALFPLNDSGNFAYKVFQKRYMYTSVYLCLQIAFHD